MELFRALGALLEPPGPETVGIARLLELGAPPAREEHAELFLFQLYPYASVHLGREGKIGGEARDRVAGFWRALGERPPPEPDHLGTLLGLYARIAELESWASGPEGVDAWRRARSACLWEHLASWVLPFLAKLAEVAPPFYRRWGGLLEAAFARETAELGPPERLPLALREAEEMADPRRGGAGEFLNSLLSPVRSGLVLTRADLARAGRELGLGLRIGERAFILKAMLGQDGAGTLDWLRDEARVWAERHDRTARVAPAVAAFWGARARATIALLCELRDAELGPGPS